MKIDDVKLKLSHNQNKRIFFLYCGIFILEVSFLQVMLKMKSRHVAGTITKKKKSKFLLCFLSFFLLLMM